MPKKLRYDLTRDQIKIIESVMAHEKSAEVVRRTTAIHLLYLGHPPRDVARMVATSLSTIYNWHHRWIQGGIAGLVTQPRSGRPPRHHSTRKDPGSS